MYHKNAQQNTAKTPNDLPQKRPTKYRKNAQ
jgi:hypothetical protein